MQLINPAVMNLFSSRKPKPSSRCLDSFSRATVTKYHRLHGLNNRNFLLHSSGGWKSELKVLAGLVPPKAGREDLFYASCLVPDGLL